MCLDHIVIGTLPLFSIEYGILHESWHKEVVVMEVVVGMQGLGSQVFVVLGSHVRMLIPINGCHSNAHYT